MPADRITCTPLKGEIEFLNECGNEMVRDLQIMGGGTITVQNQPGTEASVANKIINP